MNPARSFEDLVRWRRDVRRFRPDPVDPELIENLIGLADLSPSVGNSQPWRIVEVRDKRLRAEIQACFKRANDQAAAGYREEKAELYGSLKLAGFDRAPVHVAIYCEQDAEQGARLGTRTMPEMLSYSCVSFVVTLWYAAQAQGLGLGWVSILRPGEVNAILAVPSNWTLIGYLLLGWPEEEHEVPELERAGWQHRTAASSRRFIR